MKIYRHIEARSRQKLRVLTTKTQCASEGFAGLPNIFLE